jgi:ABC-type transport system involved in multi-copper enzyme maturation permease subunit
MNKTLTIAYYTFKELLKSKVLYITLGIGFALMMVTYVATEFTYGVPEKVALDFGLGMLSLSSLGIALFMGASLLSSEIDSRTVYMVISRPVPRWVFISGKLLGLVGVLIINLSILSLMTLSCSYLLGGEINQLIIVTIFFNLVESILLLLLVVFFSLFSNSILASTISLVILVLGHAVKETRMVSFVELRPFLGKVLDFYHLVLPGFYKLNFKDFVLYSPTIGWSYVFSSLAYGLLYSSFLFFMIIFIFNRKNLD